ncbi:MAG: endolytic transglycosylase MltG [Candidatus Komeilibacteria bacterium]|nr:endolytic transglycosylase MltG [Candidatus Komeilibacteria bacterium]
MGKFFFQIITSLVVIVAVVIIWSLYQLLAPPINSGQYPANFVIRQGAGVHEISHNLFSQKLIRQEFIWQSWVWYKKLGASFIAGDYQLPRPFNGLEITDLLTNQPTSRINKLTFPEGWTARQMGQMLEGRGLAQTEELLEVVGFPGVDYRTVKADPPLTDYSKLYSFLADKPSQVGLEGYLFPDTYFINDPFTIQALVKKMLDNFGRKVDSNLQAEIKRQGKTIYEIITLASIVEKEVATDADRAMVADIFLKRLKAGIGLQSDATVNYITGKNHLQPLLTDTKIDSPYNTYKYRGLPPGPINNPSLSAILAVINPKVNPYYYFLTTSDNRAIYAKTHEEHLVNKRQYLK